MKINFEQHLRYSEQFSRTCDVDSTTAPVQRQIWSWKRKLLYLSSRNSLWKGIKMMTVKGIERILYRYLGVDKDKFQGLMFQSWECFLLSIFNEEPKLLTRINWGRNFSPQINISQYFYLQILIPQSSVDTQPSSSLKLAFKMQWRLQSIALKNLDWITSTFFTTIYTWVCVP